MSPLADPWGVFVYIAILTAAVLLEWLLSWLVTLTSIMWRLWR